MISYFSVKNAIEKLNVKAKLHIWINHQVLENTWVNLQSLSWSFVRLKGPTKCQLHFYFLNHVKMVNWIVFWDEFTKYYKNIRRTSRVFWNRSNIYSNSFTSIRNLKENMLVNESMSNKIIFVFLYLYIFHLLLISSLLSYWIWSILSQKISEYFISFIKELDF